MPAPTHKYATVFDGQERNEGRAVNRTGKWGDRFRHRLLSAVRPLHRTALEDGVGGLYDGYYDLVLQLILPRRQTLPAGQMSKLYLEREADRTGQAS